jgi:hypothetical protein
LRWTLLKALTLLFCSLSKQEDGLLLILRKKHRRL